MTEEFFTMPKIDWNSTKVWGILALVATVLLTGATLMLGPYFDKPAQQKVFQFLASNGLLLIIIALILSIGLTLVVLLLKTNREVRSLRKRLVVKQDPKFSRWESILERGIQYGHLAYHPLLYYRMGDDHPMGIGITLLEMIFGKDKIKAVNKKALWGEFAKELSDGRYDIVATPIFETRERSQQLSFCSPMFYSDIGMYVKRGSGHFGHIPPNSQSFEQAIKLAKRIKNLNIVAIDGEISGKMVLKYLGLSREDVREWLTLQTASVNSLIMSLTEDNLGSEIAFAEVFQAEQTEAFKTGLVFNLLRPKEVLYPVSFSLRKSDYVLKNFINLKLLEIEETYEGGILAIVFDELRKHEEYKKYTFADVKRYFVRELNGVYGLKNSHGLSPHVNGSGPDGSSGGGNDERTDADAVH